MTSLVHVEWGPTGAASLTADVVVVIDVLSFTTTACVALEQGMTVLPYRWRDEHAAGYAVARGATLAVGRLEARTYGGSAVSLSPAAVARATGVERIVLPSPNGSTICALLAERGATVVTASLRNRSAVARWLTGSGHSFALVAAGERWPDDTLRPAVEDLWGAGAVLAAAADLGADRETWTPEARLAEAAFRAVAPTVRDDLLACTSGRELVDAGFADDVGMAAELDAAVVVPLLVDGELLPA